MYQIVLKKKAKKFIDKLPIAERKRIVTAIGNLPMVKISKDCRDTKTYFV